MKMASSVKMKKYSFVGNSICRLLFTDVVSASEDDTETLELFSRRSKAELKEYLGMWNDGTYFGRCGAGNKAGTKK